MKPRRRWFAALAVVTALVAAWLLRERMRGEVATENHEAKAADRARETARLAGRSLLADPLTGRRGKISGKVADRAGQPVAEATVCGFAESEELSSNETREPLCTQSGAGGLYELDGLLAARYQISASAPGFRPTAYREGTRDYVELSLGEARAGVDLVLAAGGVELRGVVKDIGGGVVAKATVVASGGMWGSADRAVTRTDVQGHFKLFVSPGRVEATASASGYTNGSKSGTAPGQFLEILLTPESVLTGQVVDASTRVAVAGAQVVAEIDSSLSLASVMSGSETPASTFTDQEGKFRIERLPPGRYKPTAEAPGRRGTARESVLVGLGQTSRDIVIEVHRAIEVSGRIVIAAAGDHADTQRPCVDGTVSLADKKRRHAESARTDQRGVVWWKAVLPGSYVVRVECSGLLPRDSYPSIEIADKDVSGLLWVVDEGRRISGIVVDADGGAVADAHVTARAKGGDPRAERRWIGDTTRQDGKFTLAGLAAGEHLIEVSAEGQAEPPEPIEVVLPPGQDVDNLRVMLQRGGDVEGKVVDEDGAVVSGVQVEANGARWRWGHEAVSRDDGTFLLKGLAAGEYRVVASRQWWDDLRAPGSGDDDVQGVRVIVKPGNAAHVKLTVERQSGTISGKVLDERGKPVSDAFVDAERESESAAAAEGSARRSLRWGWDRQPVLTEMDGRFVLKKLSPGSYTLHAYRRGGGEALAERVSVGGSVTLTIRATGALRGTVHIRGGGAPESFSIHIVAPKDGFTRDEDFFRSTGEWSMSDLPAATYRVSADAPEGGASVEATLAEGEQRAGLSLELEPHATVRGRLVDLQSGAPVPGMRASVILAKGGAAPMFMFDGTGGKEVSDADGRFEVEGAPTGRVVVQLIPMDFELSNYGFSRVPARVEEGKVNELPDLRLARRRVKLASRGGDLGFEIKASSPDDDPETRRLVVAVVRPDGPAARSGLRVGDAIAAVDGHDVAAANAYLYSSLVAVPEGVSVELRLERGVAVHVTAASPL